MANLDPSPLLLAAGYGLVIMITGVGIWFARPVSRSTGIVYIAAIVGAGLGATNALIGLPPTPYAIALGLVIAAIGYAMIRLWSSEVDR